MWELETSTGRIEGGKESIFREHGLAPHRPRLILLWEADEPMHVEDVSTTVERKLHALEAHESQFESTMKAVDPTQLDAFRDRITTRLAGLGAPHGMTAAEVFARINDHMITDLAALLPWRWAVATKAHKLAA